MVTYKEIRESSEAKFCGITVVKKDLDWYAPSGQDITDLYSLTTLMDLGNWVVSVETPYFNTIYVNREDGGECQISMRNETQCVIGNKILTHAEFNEEWRKA